jgi:integrase/recombinase XerC
MQALKEYLWAREGSGLKSLTPISSEPVFARHDIGASRRTRPITAGTAGMWKALKDRMTEAGVDPHSLRIHDFRHCFVTKTSLAKRDLKLSQELARHESIATTMRYAHFGNEADAAYDDIFNKKIEPNADHDELGNDKHG